MKRLLAESSVHIDAIAYCPHDRAGDFDCRKPKAGLADSIEKQLGPIDYASSWVVGDKESDIGFGKLMSATSEVRVAPSPWSPFGYRAFALLWGATLISLIWMLAVFRWV